MFITSTELFFLDDDLELVDRYSTRAPEFGDHYLLQLKVATLPTANFDTTGKKLGVAIVKLLAGIIHNTCGRKTEAVQLIKEGIEIFAMYDDFIGITTPRSVVYLHNAFAVAIRHQEYVLAGQINALQWKQRKIYPSAVPYARNNERILSSVTNFDTFPTSSACVQRSLPKQLNN